MSEIDHLNMLAVKGYAETTRSMLREAEERVLRAENRVIAIEQLFEQQRIQIASLQQRVFAGGTSGD